MDGVSCLQSSQHSLPSPDGTLIATILGSQLVVRSSFDGQLCQSYALPAEDGSQYRFLRWSRHGINSSSHTPSNFVGVQRPLRILLVNDEIVRVYEVEDPQWKAVIRGAAGGLGKIVNVDFGSDENEVLVFSDFAVKVTIWSLKTNRGAEIRDPKAGENFDFRPSTGHLAIITRAAAHDNLMLLAPGAHQASKSVELPTVDAQGIKWSPDGRWLAIWDAAGSGYRIAIYTADGHLFRSYEGGHTSENIGMGIKSVAWDPNTTFLAVGDYENDVTLLNSKTFSPIATLSHPLSIESSQTVVWEEQIDNTGLRNYAIATQPAHPPPSSSFARGKTAATGVSLIEFNKEGTFFATKSDAMPSTIWIWSHDSLAPAACLIHHSPVRSAQWHPTKGDMLLLHCAIDQPTVHVWSVLWSKPLVVDLHLHKTGGKLEACWLSTATHEYPRLMVTNTHNYVVVSLNTDGVVVPVPLSGRTISSGPDDRFDEGNSMDLSPIKISQDSTTANLIGGLTESSNQWGQTVDLDDTFDYRRPLKVTR